MSLISFICADILRPNERGANLTKWWINFSMWPYCTLFFNNSKSWQLLLHFDVHLLSNFCICFIFQNVGISRATSHGIYNHVGYRMDSLFVEPQLNSSVLIDVSIIINHPDTVVLMLPSPLIQFNRWTKISLFLNCYYFYTW